jgi:hypothetical protein
MENFSSRNFCSVAVPKAPSYEYGWLPERISPFQVIGSDGLNVSVPSDE